MGISCTVACGDEAFEPLTGDKDAFFWEVRVSPGAIQMSTVQPHNTTQLNAVAYATDGSVMTINDTSVSTVWTSSDSSKVYVSQDGVITGVSEADLVMVQVAYRIGEQTRTDSVQVRVFNDPALPQITTFSIVPQDSLKRASANFMPYEFPVVALDANGNAITGFPIRWHSSNLKIVKPSTWGYGWEIHGIGAGRVQMSAEALVYGVQMRDSFSLEIGWPIWTFFQIVTEIKQVATQSGSVIFVPFDRVANIGPGGMLAFINNNGRGPINIPGVSALPGKNIDIIFDDPSIALGTQGSIGDTIGIPGNIIGLPSDTTLGEWDRTQWRRFTQPGIHYYTIQPFGVRGSIHVHDK